MSTTAETLPEDCSFYIGVRTAVSQVVVFGPYDFEDATDRRNQLRFVLREGEFLSEIFRLDDPELLEFLTVGN